MTVSKTNYQSDPSGTADQPPDPSNGLKTAVLPFVAPTFVPAVGDSQEGNLATLINSSTFTRWFIHQLPAYRLGVSPFQRGLQVGLSHGFWLLGPFVTLGPLRHTALALLAGLLATIALVVIATCAIALYAESEPLPPIATLTTPDTPADLSRPQGWRELARGFLLGGTAGAIFAAILLLIFSL